MEKNPQTFAAVAEFELPEQVIQQIQSLMSDQREAARTTLVSKSWHGAWATSPNLSFDEYDLRNRLPQLSKKALQRYEHHNLKIQSFSLHMYGKHSLARELISKAMELGATDLTIRVEDDDTVSFVLPDEVLESQTLTRLSASCCTVDLGRRKKDVAPCSTLKSFNLSGVTVNDDFFNDLSWRFPLIEELTLKQPASLLALDDVGAMVKLQKLKSLRVESLQLDWFDIRESFSKHDLWPQFPCLKELVLIQDFAYSFCNGIRIFSPSLERIVIILCRAHGNVNAEFDVPNIRYLKLGCVGFPRLKFETTMMKSREWVLDLEISHWDREATSLKQFVQALSCVSRVSLHIDMELGYINWREGYVGDDGSGVAAVENLTLQNVRVTSAFLDDLSRSCRPNFIYIERNKLWDVEGKALRQLRRLPWKANASSSVNPRRFQPKFFNDLEDLFAVREGRTLSDAEFVRFELRQLKKKQKKKKKMKMKKKKEKKKKRRRYW